MFQTPTRLGRDLFGSTVIPHDATMTRPDKPS